MIKVPFLSLFLPLIFFISAVTSQKKCGHLDACNYLIPYFIFQKGACGRAARCNWELLHLEEKLQGDVTNVGIYEGNIKKMLCNIPTLQAYTDAQVNEEDLSLESYYPCGIPLPPDPDPKNPRPLNYVEYPFYPMTTFYTFTDKNGKYNYLNRMQECAEEESMCTIKLAKTVDDLCDKDLTPSHFQKVEAKFEMKLRNHKFYQLATIHPQKLALLGIKPDNQCGLFQIRRKRSTPGTNGDDNGVPTFDDDHDFNRIDKRLRGPYFDLYILYEADPNGNFAKVPMEDRWWNETKAYQELAHYLPDDMLQEIHRAIKCVYDTAAPMELEWKPEKFCWYQSTFVCVDTAKLKGNACAGGRHDYTGTEVPAPP